MFFHQAPKMLVRKFNIPLSDAKGIVQACPDCQGQVLGVGLGANPRGLRPLQLWPMDVTHVPSFGRLKYVHVTVDTFSHAVWATPLSGEAAQHVMLHLRGCFAVLGVPFEIKTDNGPAYTSQALKRFMNVWGVKHVTGIPHSPTGQAIVERVHQVIKQLLLKQKGGDEGNLSPVARIQKVIYVLNFLRFVGTDTEPPAVIHSPALGSGHKEQKRGILVQYKDPETGVWKGPAELQYSGRGYVCIITERGPRWIPARWVRPWKGLAENPVAREQEKE
ncbi:PREDICTED: endogenous retrovirus group K member 8 Pol protein-like [Calidris pugnax]|uniref:endogenous retrovirus group K member 8 Pol protein-like n=1 Tax=Calidris pugnax TaxID=198806 RepID=UPI00071D2D30|nr:PREDICTED: endogenous retrovirus group K member 8 Pol protein-like [Calidris pugnax]